MICILDTAYLYYLDENRTGAHKVQNRNVWYDDDDNDNNAFQLMMS